MSLIDVTRKNDYEIWRMNRGRANPINDDLVTAIRQEMARATEDSAVRGVILTGNTDGFFSVGLDLKALYYYDEAQIMAFWENWQEMVYELAAFPKPIVCAINGHSPAGGCVLAVTCDYRLMANGEKYRIGLNEVAVGITVPEYIYILYSFWIGTRLAYQNLLTGRLLSPAEAAEQNLVDEICEVEELLPKAEAKIQQILRAPDNVLYGSKKALRAELSQRLTQTPPPDLQDRLKAWFNPESRALMKQIVERL